MEYNSAPLVHFGGRLTELLYLVLWLSSRAARAFCIFKCLKFNACCVAVSEANMEDHWRPWQHPWDFAEKHFPCRQPEWPHAMRNVEKSSHGFLSSWFFYIPPPVSWSCKLELDAKAARAQHSTRCGSCRNRCADAVSWLVSVALRQRVTNPFSDGKISLALNNY